MESIAIGKTGLGGRRYSASIWYIYLPSDVDRELYIVSCFRTNTITLINENAEIRHQIPIGKVAIQYIEFPVDLTELGSPVMCANLPDHDGLLVVEVYENSSEFNNIEEKQIRLIRETSRASAEISLKGKTGEIFINANSDDEDGGKVYINITNSKQSAELNINVSGTIKVINNGKILINTNDEILLDIYDGNEEGIRTQIKYKAGEGFTYLDEFDNSLEFRKKSITLEGKEINVKGTKINLGKGKEPMMLGDSTTSFLSDLITTIASSTVATPSGPSPLLNSLQISAFKTRLESLKSKLSNTD